VVPPSPISQGEVGRRGSVQAAGKQRSCVLCENDFVWVISGSGPRRVGIAVADGLCDLGAETFWSKASGIGEGGPCPI
jgi:hypothetical protein